VDGWDWVGLDGMEISVWGHFMSLNSWMDAHKICEISQKFHFSSVCWCKARRDIYFACLRI